MAGAYTTTSYLTYAEWKAAIDAVAAGKLAGTETYREQNKTIFVVIVAD